MEMMAMSRWGVLRLVMVLFLHMFFFLQYKPCCSCHRSEWPGSPFWVCYVVGHVWRSATWWNSPKTAANGLRCEFACAVVCSRTGLNVPGLWDMCYVPSTWRSATRWGSMCKETLQSYTTLCVPVRYNSAKWSEMWVCPCRGLSQNRAERARFAIYLITGIAV